MIYKHTTELHNTRAAELILPLVMNWFEIKNVLDVGCGIGSWLKVVNGIITDDFIGVDGDHVDRSLLMIPESKFRVHDLQQPLNLGRRFDLAICLEVAEHLPEKAADILIETLVNHSDYILFSAAIPHQGGQNHLNEKWPSYWKVKFENYNYSFYDIVRSLIWEEKNIEWWYRQNIFLVINDNLKNNFIKGDKFIDIVHPEMYEFKQGMIDNIMKGKGGLRNAVKIFFRAIKNKLIND